jgi:hypothetical protein
LHPKLGQLVQEEHPPMRRSKYTLENRGNQAGPHSYLEQIPFELSRLSKD